MNKNLELQEYLLKNKQLFWDINPKKFNELSDEAIIERIMAYGNMTDFKLIEKIYGNNHISEIFKKLTNKKRVNLRKETINFFNLYLNYHAH